MTSLQRREPPTEGTPGRAEILSELELGQRRVFQVSEHQPVQVPLTELLTEGRLDVYPSVTGKGYFGIDLRQNRLVLKAGGYVGLIPLNDRVAIEIRPRVPIRNLTQILRKSRLPIVTLPEQVRLYDVVDVSDPSLLDLFASALLEAVGTVEQLGLLQEYRPRTEATSSPRGRVLMRETLAQQHARGILHKVVSSWSDRCVDNACNRCLKFALWSLGQQYTAMRGRAGVAAMLARLNRAYHVFYGVDLDRSKGFLIDRLVQDPTRLPPVRGYYRDALRIAAAIIREQTVLLDPGGSDLRLSSVVINMEDVFEAYLFHSLKEQLQHTQLSVLDGRRLSPGYGGKRLFDEPESEPANPDIVVRSQEGESTTSLVLDAKYKPMSGSPARDDINQVITYAASYRTHHVVVVQPCRQPDQAGVRKVGSIDDLTVWQYGFNLNAADLAMEEQALGEAVLNMVMPEAAEPDSS
jgi:5-methylcytosine-specific restriction enzyme subunit McrC